MDIDDRLTLQTGDVLLQRPRGLTVALGMAIEAFAGTYSHARLAYDEHVAVDVWWPGGGRYESIGEIGVADLYRYKGKLNRDQVEIMKSFMEKATTRSYDLPQFLWYVPQTLLQGIDWFRGPNRFDDENKYICSELVDRAYLAAGIDLVPEVEDGDATPYELSNSEHLDFIGKTNSQKQEE